MAFILVAVGYSAKSLSVWRSTTLQWRRNGRNGASNHQPQHCLLNRLFRCRSKKTSKLRVTGLCAGNSPVTVEFPYKWPVTRKMFPFDDIIMNQRSLSSTVFCTHIWLFAYLSKDMPLYVLHLHISANTSTYEYKSDLYVLRTCILSHLSVGIYLKRQTLHYCSLNTPSSNKCTYNKCTYIPYKIWTIYCCLLFYCDFIISCLGSVGFISPCPSWMRHLQPHDCSSASKLSQTDIGIEDETKLPTFRRQHFEVYFLGWKCLNFASHFTEVCS